MGVSKVLIIRHGETDHNVARRIQGSLPTPLNANGILQAQALGLYLKHHHVERLYTSTLERASHTANLIAEVTGSLVIEDDRLQEMNFGVFEGKTFSEIEQEYPRAYAGWTTRNLDFVVPGGESRSIVMQRMASAWQDIIQTGAHTVGIVSHGLAIRLLIQYLFYKPPIENIGNTSLTEVYKVDDIWRISSFVQTPHLND